MFAHGFCNFIALRLWKKKNLRKIKICFCQENRLQIEIQLFVLGENRRHSYFSKAELERKRQVNFLTFVWFLFLSFFKFNIHPSFFLFSRVLACT